LRVEDGCFVLWRGAAAEPERPMRACLCRAQLHFVRVVVAAPKAVPAQAAQRSDGFGLRSLQCLRASPFSSRPSSVSSIGVFQTCRYRSLGLDLAQNGSSAGEIWTCRRSAGTALDHLEVGGRLLDDLRQLCGAHDYAECAVARFGSCPVINGLALRVRLQTRHNRGLPLLSRWATRGNEDRRAARQHMHANDRAPLVDYAWHSPT
jgi:hypothetical protein